MQRWIFPMNMLMKANKESSIPLGSNPLTLSHAVLMSGEPPRGKPRCAHRATCATVPMKAPKEEGDRNSRLFLCGWDMLLMHLWAGGDCLALHLPTAQTAHRWSFSMYVGISHARASMLQL